VKPLFVGQAPSESLPVGARALSGRSGRRLASLAGLTLDEFLAAADTVNVFDAFTGKAGKKGDAFPLAEARHRADVLRRANADRETVVLLGSLVAAAFDLDELADAPCSWYHGAGDSTQRVGFLPHPSGIDRWYNDAANVKRAARFVRSALGLGGL